MPRRRRRRRRQRQRERMKCEDGQRQRARYSGQRGLAVRERKSDWQSSRRMAWRRRGPAMRDRPFCLCCAISRSPAPRGVERAERRQEDATTDDGGSLCLHLLQCCIMSTFCSCVLQPLDHLMACLQTDPRRQTSARHICIIISISRREMMARMECQHGNWNSKHSGRCSCQTSSSEPVNYGWLLASQKPPLVFSSSPEAFGPVTLPFLGDCEAYVRYLLTKCITV